MLTAAEMTHLLVLVLSIPMKLLGRETNKHAHVQRHGEVPLEPPCVQVQHTHTHTAGHLQNVTLAYQTEQKPEFNLANILLPLLL